MIRIQLEKGEKLPLMFFSQKGSVEETCDECGETFRIYLHESVNNDGRRWLKGECRNCGNNITMTPKQCDLIQPSSNLFKLYYGHDPIALEQRKRREREIEKDKSKYEREERIKLKVKQGILKPWQVGDVRSYVREHNLE